MSHGTRKDGTEEAEEHAEENGAEEGEERPQSPLEAYATNLNELARTAIKDQRASIHACRITRL